MKKYLLSFVFYNLSTNLLFAQVVVNHNHMPVPGDTLFYIQHVGLLPVDPANTGADYTWDYSSLSGTTQRLDSFISVTSAPLFSVATFNNPLDPLHRATVAIKTTPPQVGGSFSPITFQDFYTFYRNKNTEFATVGVAATVSINGSTPANLPAKYSALDILYKFPLNFGNKDSSLSSYKFDLGASGYFSEKRFRKNHVDGYGDLITPFGTFQTIRVKSFSEIEDTVYFNNFPLKFKRYETVYSWLAPGFHGPLVRITYNSLTPTATGTPQAEYLDVSRFTNSIKKIKTENNLVKRTRTGLWLDNSLFGKDLYLFTPDGQLIEHFVINSQHFSKNISHPIAIFYIPEFGIGGHLLTTSEN